jgi:hypothetical protein
MLSVGVQPLCGTVRHLGNWKSEGAFDSDKEYLGVSSVIGPRPPSKEPYILPRVNTLTREQAALFLLGKAWDGDQNAKRLLELGKDVLFPPPAKP